MALDKNYIDVTDDSLSRTALNYFDKWGPKKYKARALYYLGVYYYNIGENKKAIVEFTKSEDLARKAKDGVYLYLSLSTQSDTYSKIYNDVEQENCLLKATEVVEAYDLDKYRDYVDLSLAQAYINTRNIEKSSEILNKLINRGNTDSVVVGNAISSLAFLKMVQDVPDPEASAELFSKVYEEYGAMGMKLNDFWAWATALHMIGNIQAADELITQLDKEADIPQSYYWKYKIAKNNDDFENAFNYLEKAWDEGGEEVNLALRQSLSRYQRDYYEAISLVESNKATKRSYIIIICSFIALFIFLISN
jgi:tetratricopeptide (TPR) repeat protein